jgi:hypothetical protein
MMDKNKFRWLAIFLPALGVLLAILYSLTAFSDESDAWKYVAHAAGIFLLISGASFLGAALIGFLFGFPRTTDEQVDEVNKKPKYQHNKSIEQISDWILKMLIGIGLSQMINLPRVLWSCASTLTQGISTVGGQDGATSVATCLIVFFMVCGFIYGFLATRLGLLPILIQSDQIN